MVSLSASSSHPAPASPMQTRRVPDVDTMSGRGRSIICRGLIFILSSILFGSEKKNVCSQGRTSPCGADAILSPVCGGGGGLWSMLIIYAQFFCWGVVRLDGVVMW